MTDDLMTLTRYMLLEQKDENTFQKLFAILTSIQLACKYIDSKLKMPGLMKL